MLLCFGNLRVWYDAISCDYCYGCDIEVYNAYVIGYVEYIGIRAEIGMTRISV